jgi:hypothetical protein
MELDQEILVRFVEALLSNPNVWDQDQRVENLNLVLSTAVAATQKVLLAMLNSRDAIDEDDISYH